MSIMIFMFLCFCGLAVMFYHTLRSQEQAYDALRKEITALRQEVGNLRQEQNAGPIQELTEALAPERLQSEKNTASGDASLDIHLG